MLVPRPGKEPSNPALELQSLNHWTTREVRQSSRLLKQFHCTASPAIWCVDSPSRLWFLPLADFAINFTPLCFDSDFF